MFAIGSTVVVAILFGLAPPEARDTGAADAVTLRDGTVVLGDLVESAPKAGTLTLVARRDWLRKHAPAWLERWEAAEAPVTKRANAQRRDRLDAWRRERLARTPAADDRVSPWIERELARLKDGDGAGTKSRLIAARVSRGEVRNVRKATPAALRSLRLAWVTGLPDPEGLRAADRDDALEGRGLDPAGKAPVPLDALLPPQPETDAAWLVRRAATEVTADPGLRFVRYGSLVVPEPATGQPLDAGAGLAAVSALKDLLGENTTDPLAAKLREVAAAGKVGAVVTRLDVAPDASGVTVESTLWVRHGADRWAPAGSRTARVSPEELGADAGKDLADDPQIAGVFRVVEGLGLGLNPDIKRRSLGIGAATRKALGQVRAAAEADLATLALPVLGPPKEDAPKDGPP